MSGDKRNRVTVELPPHVYSVIARHARERDTTPGKFIHFIVDRWCQAQEFKLWSSRLKDLNERLRALETAQVCLANCPLRRLLRLVPRLRRRAPPPTPLPTASPANQEKQRSRQK